MAQRKAKDDVLLRQVCEFIWQFSNVCWNLGGEGEHKRTQELGAERLMELMPSLCSAFLHRLSVAEDSPFGLSAQMIDEALEQGEIKCTVKKKQTKAKPSKGKKTK